MSKWKNFRTWINKNDGSFYRIDNQDLTSFEVIGYLLSIAALIIYLLHKKTGLEQSWLGWILLIIGFVLVMIGAIKKASAHNKE